MNYFHVEPALPGELSRNCVFEGGTENRVYPLVLLRAHYELDDVPDDALFTSYPMFVVSDLAKEALLEAKFTGFQFDDVEISKSIHYIAQYGEDQHPGEFFWV